MSSSRSRDYDAIIVGTGQAGPPLAERMSDEGLRVAIIERKLVGGTCVNVGCIPTKALVGSARVAHAVRHCEEFGIAHDGALRANMAQVHARMAAIAKASNDGVTSWLENMQNVELIRGHARFTGPKTLDVNGNTITAERIFLDVGARARVPDIEGLADIDYLTNSTLLDLDVLPEHLLIVGGSYIGLEFAQIYRRFGAQVTVVEMGERLIAREDQDVSAAVTEILEGEGVTVRLTAQCLSLARDGNAIRANVDCVEGAPNITCSHVLIATGRIPNTDDLGLDRAGVAVDSRGQIVVDDALRTNVDGIWALGEVNGRGAFTHTTYNDYEIVAANLFDAGSRDVRERINCYGLFIDPPLGRVGMTEREVRDSGRRALIGTLPMTRVSRAKEFGETRGFIKILVDAESQRILGASILGLSGDETVHGLLDVMYADRPYTVISRATHIHPTVSELIPTVLQKLKPLAAEATAQSS